MVDHWWQTETGWAITAGFRGFGLFPFKPGSGGRPWPGYDLHALDDDGQRPPGQTGNLGAPAAAARLRAHAVAARRGLHRLPV